MITPDALLLAAIELALLDSAPHLELLLARLGKGHSVRLLSSDHPALRLILCWAADQDESGLDTATRQIRCRRSSSNPATPVAAMLDTALSALEARRCKTS